MKVRALALGCVAGLVMGLGLPGVAIAMSKVAEPASRLTAAEQQKADAMIAKAIGYLRTKQDKGTGGWSVPAQGPKYPAITGLVVRGMMMQPGVTQDDAHVAMGVKFMLNEQQPDGGMYDKVLPGYNTSMCVMALSGVDTPQAKDAVKKGVEFLKSLQFGEGAVTREGMGESPKVVGKDDPFYGGWGYGRHGRPDLSNSAWAIDALHAAGVEPTDEAFKRALVFLQRTQMVEKVGETKINDMEYAKGSTQGGFVYATSVNKDKVGVGQSQAGEVVESLSGGPGTVVLVRLANAAPQKARTIAKAEVEDRLRRAAVAHPEALTNGCVVTIGASSDGATATTFEVRFGSGDAEACVQAIKAVFETELVTSAKKDGSAEMKLLPTVARPANRQTDSEARRAFNQLADSAGREEGLLYVFGTSAWKGESRLRAYGSMTYSGFKSYLYANLAKDDPRVTEALRWIGENYTVRENPGMGTDGLYYYYVVMAKALDAWGAATVATPSGDKRWAEELVDRLSELQNEDGSFKAVDDRWLENDPVLITAYSLLALQHAARGANTTH